MKRRISSILAALIIASLFAACEPENNEDIPNEIPSAVQTPVETKDEPSVSSDKEDTSLEELPSSVDLMDYNGKNYVTPVKRQAFGDCWSFGICAAAESSYLYENDLGVPTGEVNNNVNFSERYLSWYVYHNITEEDVLFGKVRSSQVGEGYTLGVSEERNPNVAFNMGGASLSGFIMFASGFGPVDETIEVNGEYPYAYSDKNIVNIEDFEDYSQSGDWSIPLNAQYRNAPVSVLLRNGNILPSPASRDAEGNYKYNEEAVIAIKSEIANGRAVAVTALAPGRMNYDNWAAYTTADERNHVVTIVGYDDNYPKENFAKTDSDGEIFPDSVPPTDGAFIIKDSYGESGGFDRKGSYYISYHDHTFMDPISFEFDAIDAVKYTNLNYDQYDLLFVGWCAYTDYDNETKMANVFDAEEDEYLTQITYRTKMTNTAVHYEIYKDLKDDSPDSGVLLEEGDNSHSFGGSHKIDLKDVYELKKGEKYSVVLTMTYTTDDGKSTYTDVVPYGSSREDEVKANGVVNKGESFLLNGGEWKDLVEIKGNYCKTAFDQHKQKHLPDEFMAKDEEGIAIDNYPIKAILIPASVYNATENK